MVRRGFTSRAWRILAASRTTATPEVLSLALGLASLSSERVRVESLFIDEGFGSLDPASLDIALASLDALQSLGRQVGVISHVPAMAERIGVRIRVECRSVHCAVSQRSVVRVEGVGA